MKFPSEGWVILGGYRAAKTSNSGGLSATEMVNTNECDDAVLIVSLTKGTTGISDLAVYTSDVASFTEASDNICTLTQDVANSTGTTTGNTNRMQITVTGDYVYEIQGLKKYVNIQFAGTEADSYVSMTLIGVNPMQAPKASARSAWT